MEWTDEQNNAIKTRNGNLLVSAGAGSGKTAVLVKRIINMVLNDKIDITKILVVTFTNASASEMKERILNKMYSILEEKPDNIWLQQQIINMNRANISTIHSFCLSVIKEYYYEIGIDPNLRVTNDIDNELMKYEVLEEIFDSKYEQEKIDIEFANLLQMFDGKSGGFNTKNSLQEIILNMYTFVINHPFPEEVYVKMNECISSDISNFEQSICGKMCIEQVNQYILEVLNEYDAILDLISDDDKQLDFYNQNKRVLLDIQLKVNENIKWDDFVQLLHSFSLPKRISVKWEDEELKSEVEKHWKNIKTIEEVFSDVVSEEKIIEETKINEKELKYLINLVKEFEIKFSVKKEKNKVMDFNDFEHYALRILTKINDNDEIESSDIAKIYQAKFDEILIDEYQDSNLIQDYILSCVSRDKEGKPNIFMVGDIKQSIYKFRGATPELFMQKYESYSNDISEKYSKINLHKNFRSRKQVLDFTNYIFKNIMTKQYGEMNYSEEQFLNYGASYPDNSEKIDIDIIDMSENQDFDDDNEYSLNDEDEIKKESIEYEVGHIINRIQDLVNKKFQIIDKKTNEYRDIKYSDIVMLLRSTKNVATIFNQMFKEKNIPIYIDNSVGYLDELEVTEVISFLQIIDNPYQDIPLISVLKSPFGNFTDNELVEIRQNDKYGHFYTAMQKASILNEKVKSFISKLIKFREMSTYLTVSKLIWNIYEEYNYIEYMKKYSNFENKKANLILLFERARNFEESSYKGLFNFINFILKIKDSNQDLGSATILGENDNVVRLMSIHKSKGLEFPVVFLSNVQKKYNMMDLNNKILLNEDLMIGNEIIDLDNRIYYPSIYKQVIKTKMINEIIAEEMRMLYVALTRAKEKLIITGVSKEQDKDIQKSRTIMRNSINSYLKLLNYVIYNKGYDKNLINIKYISSNSISKIETQENKEVLNDKYINSIKNIDSVNDEIVDKYNDDIKFEYKKVYLTKIPHKITVTEIKKNAIDNDNNDTLNIYESNNILSNSIDISPMEIGNIYHNIFEKLDYTIDYTKESLELEIQKIYIKDSKEYDIIDVEKILKFLNSDIYVRIKKADKVYKEKTFMLEEKIKDLNTLFDIEEQIDENDTILVQGTVDLCFTENNEIVLIDYKTDKVKNNDVIRERYKIQLHYYKKALESILNMKVKEMYIFLIDSGEFLEME